MQLPRRLARFNRRVTNPIQRLWAGRVRGYGIIEHVGRKSGKSYRTPVNVFRTADGFAVLIGYGLESDWLKNLLAAGNGELVHRRQRFRVVDPQVVSGPSAQALLPRVLRFVSRRAHADNVLRLKAG
jgi:deazaflavin-dependent oxidoreductase (nitroreductase family)